MSGATSRSNTFGKETNEFRLDKPRESDARRAAEKQRRLQAEMQGRGTGGAAGSGEGGKRKKSGVGCFVSL